MIGNLKMFFLFFYQFIEIENLRGHYQEIVELLRYKFSQTWGQQKSNYRLIFLVLKKLIFKFNVSKLNLCKDMKKKIFFSEVNLHFVNKIISSRKVFFIFDTFLPLISTYSNESSVMAGFVGIGQFSPISFSKMWFYPHTYLTLFYGKKTLFSHQLFEYNPMREAS